MATLYIKEFTDQGLNATNTPMPVPLETGSATEQTVAIGAGSLQSAAFQNSTQLVLVNADVICSIKVGVNPTAVATTHRLAAGGSYLFAVPNNSGLKIAVITNA
jgi:hypothetical protein